MTKQNKRKLSEEETQQVITLSTDAFSNNTAPVGNKIYLYDEINRSSILTVSKQIDEVTRQLKLFQLFYNLNESPCIELYISTDGGDVSPALALVDKIKSNIIPINTYVEGMVEKLEDVDGFKGDAGSHRSFDLPDY